MARFIAGLDILVTESDPFLRIILLRLRPHALFEIDAELPSRTVVIDPFTVVS